MLTHLLDLLTPAQMFHLLNDFAANRTVVSEKNVERWMLDNGFKHDDIKDGSWWQDHTRRWSVAAFVEKQANK